jgi:CDP-diacylglycerol--glycerol-3-phosphate 3-phosphatidyltransferase
MNIPNSITFTRLIAAIVSFVFMFQNEWFIASILILLAVLLDVFDGILARKYKQVTTQGGFFDVMADKVVIISTFLVIGLLINRGFFFLGLVMLLREYSIDTMRSIAATSGKTIKADKFSKIKGVLFMISMNGVLWNKVLFQDPNLDLVFLWISIITMIFCYITLVFVFKNNYMILKK